NVTPFKRAGKGLTEKRDEGGGKNRRCEKGDPRGPKPAALKRVGGHMFGWRSRETAKGKRAEQSRTTKEAEGGNVIVSGGARKVGSRFEDGRESGKGHKTPGPEQGPEFSFRFGTQQ